MKLDEALKSIQKCVPPEFENDSNLQLIREQDFYYPPSLKQICADENSRFILFSAPGAVGKTSLAKYIAYHYNALYWDVSKHQVWGTAFAGEIAHAVGPGHGALQDAIYQNLKTGKVLFVLDAFDEAALISRRDGVEEFLAEIGEYLDDALSPSVILTARTEMAEFILGVCRDKGFGVTCYEIDYFEEADSISFIVNYLKHAGKQVGSTQEENIKGYFSAIKEHLGLQQDQRSFMGYAQVLSILARRLEMEIEDNPRLDGISLSASADHSDASVIYSIIQELIKRESGKLSQFKESIRGKYTSPSQVEIINSLYHKSEQLVRLQFFVATGGSITLDDYPSCSQLLPEDQEAYLSLLNDWIPQHVFLRNRKVMPIFEDYLLAESLLNDDLALFTDQYRSRLPTRAFMDCYLSLNHNCVNSEHIYYIDLAYSSQASTGSKAYCDISPLDDDISSDADLGLYLTLVDSIDGTETSTSFKIARAKDAPICLCRAENMSIAVEGKVTLSSSFLKDVTVRQSSIECDCLELNAGEVIFETHGDEENSIIVHDSITRLPDGKIAIRGTRKLKVELPEENINQYKSRFYEFAPYLCSFSSESTNGKTCDDITQFSYGLKKVLEQFKTDNYGGHPAKHKEKIDARCHSGCKGRVLAFLKAISLVYEDGIMYKANLEEMEELKINWVSYMHLKHEQLRHIYSLYQKWFKDTLCS